MTFTVGDFEIAKARAVLPAEGVWSVRAELVGNRTPVEGARVTVSLGDLRLSGTLRTAKVYVDVAEVLVVGGADGWRRNVPARRYRGDNGILLSQVAGDLAQEVGETIGPLGALASAIVGYAWIRPAGVASTALYELGRPWYVDLDGTTRIGERPRVQRTGLRLGVIRYRPTMGLAELTTPDDRFASLVPGSVLSVEGLPAGSLVRATTIKIADQDASAEVDIG